jgi:hypothetical protein
MFFCMDYKSQGHKIHGDYSSMSSKVCRVSTKDGICRRLLVSRVSTKKDGMPTTKVKPTHYNRGCIHIEQKATSRR